MRVWDLPTRLFHWALALSLVGSFVSAEIGGSAMVWHFRFGYTVVALLAFRLLWGLVGGRWASFVYSPATLLGYLRGRGDPAAHLDVGHNPLGSLSVFAMLGLLAVQVSTGLVADDEIALVGPLNRYVSGETGLEATSWHTHWGQRLLLALIGLHVAAIVWYRFARGVHLIGPMVFGDKRLAPGTPASADGAAQRLLALALFALCAGGIAWAAALLG